MQSTPLFNLDPSQLQSVPAIEAEMRTTLPWLWAPAFKINEHEGYDGRHFGARTGPREAMCVTNVLHEVAHATEITLLQSRVWKRRIKQPAFAMRIKTFQTIGGQQFFEPITMQATERECRVGGIQLRLLEAGGYDTQDFVDSFSLTLKYMADWYIGGDCPLNAHDPLKYTDGQRQWLAVRMQLVHDAYRRFPLSDIQNRWGLVMQHLQALA